MYLAKKLMHYGNHTLPRFGKIPKGIIEFYHLTFVLKGEMRYIADGVVYDLKENDALLLPPGTNRERLGGNDPVKFVIFNFTTDDTTKIPLGIHLKSVINQHIKKILSVYPNITYYTCTTEQTKESQKTHDIMINILNCILIELIDSERKESGSHHVSKAIQFINNNITYPISLNDVCRAVHLTKEYTAKIFKDETGKTITEYINEQKMLLAKDMLTSEEISLRDIANNLGYENYSYFSKVFKKHFQTAPIKMRNK